jgi:hypothetical protein
MARKSPEDPHVTDLARYRKAREQAKRRPAPRPPAPSQGLLGSNPRARLILALLALALVVMFLLPQLMRLL